MAYEAGVAGRGLLYREICPERRSDFCHDLAGCILCGLFHDFRSDVFPGRASIFPEHRCGFALELHSDFAEGRLVRSFELNPNSNGGLSFDRIDLLSGWDYGSDSGEEYSLAFPCACADFAKAFSWTTLAVNPLSSRAADNRKCRIASAA